MDAKQFLAEFGHIVNAPEGVRRLREMILLLAIKGELSQGDVNDTPVELTLKKLARRRKEILTNYCLTATKKHKNLGKANGDYDLPTGWTWEFLGYISSWPLKDGDWVESKDQNPNGGVRLIQLADIGVGKYRNRSARFLTEEKAKELNCYFLQNGDVLIARLPDPLGRACIFPGDNKPCVTVVDVAVCRCEPEYINSQYLMICINSEYIKAKIESMATGTTRKRVATGKLGSLSIPIPPLEEQKRIVAKVDELMALCDKLEAQQQKRRKLQTLTRTTVLDALANAQSPHELKDAWLRVQENFYLLISDKDSIEDLNRTIIDLGISGHLTSTRIDEIDLDEIVRARIKKLIKEKTLRKRKWIDDIHATNKIDFPTRYKKVYLGNVAELITDGEHATPKRISGAPIPLVTAKNIRDGFFDLRNTDFVQNETAEKAWIRCKPRTNDILMVCVGATTGRLLVARDPVDMVLVRSVALIRLFGDLFLPEFVAYCLKSSWGYKQIWRNVKQAAQPCLYLSKISQIEITAPPIDEQKLILEKINRLLELTSKLGKNLDRQSLISTRLASTATGVITGTQIMEEDQMKAPKTELVSTLRLKVSPNNKDQAPLSAILAKHNGELSSKALWNYSGMDINKFYQQLKTEMARDWIVEPEKARMIEKDTDNQSGAEAG